MCLFGGPARSTLWDIVGMKVNRQMEASLRRRGGGDDEDDLIAPARHPPAVDRRDSFLFPPPGIDEASSENAGGRAVSLTRTSENY